MSNKKKLTSITNNEDKKFYTQKQLDHEKELAWAEYQNKFMVGKTYKVKVAGWRVPFLSMYRNVVSKNN